MEQMERMIRKEWEMFSSVNDGKEKASCQENPTVFFAMRRAQFAAWTEAACLSYERDLDQAAQEGRNLAEEKYIHMMQTTVPRQYAILRAKLPEISAERRQLAEQINDALLRQTELLRNRYPFLHKTGRPLHAADAYGEDTSIETYQLGELLTNSLQTLQLLQAHLFQLEEQGISLAEQIQLNSLRCIGFASFEEAAARVQ